MSTTASPSPPDGWIAYEVDAGSGLETYLVQRDGSHAHPVAPDIPGIDQTNPDWSPDGTRLVFAVTSEAGRDDLWTVGVDGGDAAMLLECGGDCVALDDPAWRPDGRSIAFTRIADVDGAVVGSLETVDVATGTVSVVSIAQPNQLYSGARWSPDGTTIVAEVVDLSGPSLDSELTGVTLTLFTLGGPTPGLFPLTDPALFAETPDWSPDGDLIVFAALPSVDAEQKDLFVVHPDGSGLTRLTYLAEEEATATHPAFSRDSAEILFVGAGHQLMRVPTAGGDVASVTGKVLLRGLHPRVQPGVNE